MDLFLKVDEGGHDQVVRAKVEALRYTEQRVQNSSSHLY